MNPPPGLGARLSMRAATLVVGVAVVLTWAPPSGATAQTSCSGVAVGAQVTIDRPASGPVPSTFAVRGRVTSTLPVSSVHLLVDGSVVATRNYGPAPNFTYEFSVGPSVARPGSRSIQVIACGNGLSLVRGQSGVVVVDVESPPVPTTVSGGPAPTSAVRPPTSVGLTTTVVVAAGPSPATTSTTKARAADKVAAAAAPPVPPGPLPAEEDALTATDPEPADGGPVRLTDDEAGDGAGSPPLWVGLVVGLSGAAGLTLSGLVRRRSAPPPPLPVEGPNPQSDRPSLGVGAR